MGKYRIDNLTDEELLNTKVKDLILPKKPIHYPEIKRLYEKLRENKIKWKPHFWPSEEWFSPDGIPGFAIPFTLYHPRLMKLEEKYLGFCEGKTSSEFFKLAIHETGHAIDNAYKLRLLKKRQQLFGLSSTPYPNHYIPNPHAKNFVIHLDDFYAQAHPDEDWAETFSVCLSQKNWRHKYKTTEAIEKLNYMKETLSLISSRKNFKRSTKTYLHSSYCNKTVRDVFREKQKALRLNRRNFYSYQLSHSFSIELTRKPKATNYLKKYESKITKDLSRLQINSWVISATIKEIKKELKYKKYHLKYTTKETHDIIKNMIFESAKDFHRQGRTKVYM